VDRSDLVLVTSRTVADVIAGVNSGIEHLDAVVADLASSNARQWNLEDLSRSSTFDSEVARTKREIDVCNVHRVRCVTELDDMFVVLVNAPTAPPVTESPGSVIDRLTVMTIRLNVLAEMTSRDPTDELAAASLATVRIQYEQLLVAFDHLMSDLRSGTRSYLSLPTTKVYQTLAARNQ
jgi:hypothetical protein